MVNVVPREVPRPKPEGPQAPRVLAAIVIATRTDKEGFLSGWVWPMDSLGSPVDIIPGLESKHW